MPHETASTATYRDMPLWQNAVDLAADISQLAAGLPGNTSVVALASIQEAALSIPTELALGQKAGKKALQAACLRACKATLEIENLLYIINRMYADSDLQTVFERTEELYNGLMIMARRLSDSKPAL